MIEETFWHKEHKSMELGARIRQLRTDRHLSQEAVAERLGVSRQAITKWESGASFPTTANLMALSEVFGISIMELTEPEGEKKRRGGRLPYVMGGLGAVLLGAGAFVLCADPLPEGVIGYADGPAGIAVYGPHPGGYLLMAAGAVCVAVAVVSFLRRRK